MDYSAGDVSIAFLSTYPPTSCGLATFTAALRGAIADGRGSEEGLGVVRLVESSRADAKPEVVYEPRNADPPSLRRAIETLSWFDGVIIQHEFGIFGGPDGEEVLDFLSDLDVPASVTLHTVLSRPSPSQRSILEGIATLAERTVVMSGAARDRLVDGYDVDAAAVRVIPHGAEAKLSGSFSREWGPACHAHVGSDGSWKGIGVGHRSVRRPEGRPSRSPLYHLG